MHGLSLNSSKKTQKLNKFMKVSDKEVYYRMFNSRVLKESYNYSDIERDIQKLAKKYFGTSDCAIYYLGSRVIGLGYDNEESDLDLFIDIGNRYFVDRDFDCDVEIIDYLKQILSEHHDWTYKKTNYSVPSLKAVHRRSGIKCDISITNGLAVHNSHMLGHLFAIQPEAVAYFHYIKKWFLLFNVRFKGFTLTLMVVFYLQQIKLMPRIRDVQEGVHPEIFIDDYAVQFDATRDREFYGIKEMKYYKDHVKGFFDFYKDFAFHLNVICTYSGDAVERGLFKEPINIETPMVISAPLLRRTNCAQYVTNLLLAEFTEACAFSSEYLAEDKHPKMIYNDYQFFDDDKYSGRHNDYVF